MSVLVHETSDVSVTTAPGVARREANVQRPKSPQRRRFVLGRWGGLVLTTLALFAGLELVTRVVLFPASKDFSRFRTYPGRAETLSRQPGWRIACMGNSLTQRGLDTNLLAASIASALEQPAAADLFTADASKVNTWHYMANRYLWQPGRQPDVLVLPFYENNLADGNRLELGRFAQFFVTFQDWPEVFEHDVTTNGDRFEFAVSSFWATYAARARIQERVLSAVVPDYQDFTSWVHSAVESQAPAQPAAAAAAINATSARTHTTLKRLLDRARANGTHVVLVAFPTLVSGKITSGPPYEIDADARRVIADAGMELVDLRQVPELSLDMYADDIHLNTQGQAVFTQIFAKVLAERLRNRDLKTARP